MMTEGVDAVTEKRSVSVEKSENAKIVVPEFARRPEASARSHRYQRRYQQARVCFLVRHIAG